MGRKSKYEESESSGEESDFDDPDKMEVPGGGLTLDALASLTQSIGTERKVACVSDSVVTKAPTRPMPSGIGKPIIVPVDQTSGLKGTNLLSQLKSQGIATITVLPKGGAMPRVSGPSQQLLRTQGPRHVLQQGQIFRPGQVIIRSGHVIRPGQIVRPGVVTMRPNMPQMIVEQGDEEELIDADEELGVTDTFSDYMPAKLKVGYRHPDPVVETASLASVEPPDVTYKLSLPYDVIEERKLSALQLEAITYACQQHEKRLPNGKRAGFLLGDGPGVGKGRTISGMVLENYILKRKKILWVSVSSDLKIDSERDLRDIGADKIKVYALNKLKYADIRSPANGSIKKGVLFSTYASLIGESSGGGTYNTRFKMITKWLGPDFDGLIVFDECHRAKNLMPTGSGKPTKTAKTVRDLQEALPNARIVYASATGATEPRNMFYMSRLGLWGHGTSFPDPRDFLDAIERRGVGAMELVAMDMKARGVYIARQLSFAGVTFDIQDVEMKPKFIQAYDESVDLWTDMTKKFEEAIDIMIPPDEEKSSRKNIWSQFWSAHQRFFKYMCMASKVGHTVRIAREAVKNGKCVVIGLQSTGEARTLEMIDQEEDMTEFVSTAKGVIQNLVEKQFPAPDRGDKIKRMLGIGKERSILEELNMLPATSAIEKTKKMRFDDSISDGKDSDSELDFSESEDEDESVSENPSDSDNPFFGSDSDSDTDPWLKKKKKEKVEKRKPKKKLKKKLSKVEEIPNIPKPFPSIEKAVSTPILKRIQDGPPNTDRVIAMKKEIIRRLEELGKKLPPNTLDQLIDELGGPDEVAEMTGRKGRMVQDDLGNVTYESRADAEGPVDMLNVRERERFQNGDKDIAIISEAASSGISLHADKRALNTKRRVHITLELPWSADRAIQQFGRTHRSNQLYPPEYMFLISDLAGERRFASIVAKRLESLGALTHGDRRAGEARDLSQFNIDDKYGRSALELVMRAFIGQEEAVVKIPDYKGNFMEDARAALASVGMLRDSETKGYELDKDHNKIVKFLNRLLGVKVHLQNAIFKFYMDTLVHVINQAKRTGRYDHGIRDLGGGGEEVKILESIWFVYTHATGRSKIVLYKVEVERGMTWQTAYSRYEIMSDNHEGFYILKEPRQGSRYGPILATRSSTRKQSADASFVIIRPSTGYQSKTVPLADLKRRYRQVHADEAREHWEKHYEHSQENCIHVYWTGRCRKKLITGDCTLGKRRCNYWMLTGSIMAVWPKLESIAQATQQSQLLQVVRMKTKTQKVVGTLVPRNAVSFLIERLKEGALSTGTDSYSI
ncbi:hypothetical protein QYM36_002818 [Artemia franciscana]|uniref:Strawberry notch n=1 Tax=Artemia franciscana TaxID=6661 RepID=A0AA88I9F3_ARTSF|nr:hypothetical protein QYM36_002818 [Artemia franciscana]